MVPVPTLLYLAWPSILYHRFDPSSQGYRARRYDGFSYTLDPIHGRGQRRGAVLSPNFPFLSKSQLRPASLNPEWFFDCARVHAPDCASRLCRTWNQKEARDALCVDRKPQVRVAFELGGCFLSLVCLPRMRPLLNLGSNWARLIVAGVTDTITKRDTLFLTYRDISIYQRPMWGINQFPKR